MTQNADQTDGDAQHTAVDPSTLEQGNEVIVTDEGEVDVRGTVEDTTVEAGRYGVTVVDDSGDEWTCWERQGRAFTRVEEDSTEHGSGDSPDWAYVFDGEEITLAFETRHDAVGFEAIWPHEGEIRAERNYSQSEPTTLVNTRTNSDRPTVAEEGEA